MASTDYTGSIYATIVASSGVKSARVCNVPYAAPSYANGRSEPIFAISRGNWILFLPAIPVPIRSRQWSADGALGSESWQVPGSTYAIVAPVFTLPMAVAGAASPGFGFAFSSPMAIAGLYPTFGGGAVPRYFKMRGYRTNTLEYETWTAQDAPNASNPSNQPITDVSVASTDRPFLAS